MARVLNPLLVRHASAWAEQRKRALHPELLETALELRSFHDDVPATAWPAGSVTDLMSQSRLDRALPCTTHNSIRWHPDNARVVPRPDSGSI